MNRRKRRLDKYEKDKYEKDKLSKKIKVEKNDDAFTILPDEVTLRILEDLDNRRDLLRVSGVNKKFYALSNDIFGSRFREAVLAQSGVLLYASGDKITYFTNKNTFKDAVNRVLSLVFPRYLEMDDPDLVRELTQKSSFLTPDQEFIDVEEKKDAEIYYFSLIKTIRNFNILCILKGVLKKINHLPKTWAIDCYEAFFRRDESCLMHYFIGSMNVEVVDLLLKNGENLNSKDRFDITPIHVLFDVISHNRDKNPHTDSWPTREFIEFLLANDANFNYAVNGGAKYQKTIADFANLYDCPLLESEVRGLQVFALLFAKNALSIISENEFRKTLSPASEKIYDKEKATIIAKEEEKIALDSIAYCP